MVPDPTSLSKFCCNFYDNLPKKGKTKSFEWTVLCCIVKTTEMDANFEMVSLGTGLKCIGVDKMSNKGYILNDSHAEVIARRAFLRYLYEQIEYAYLNHDSIFIKEDDDRLSLKNGIQFHLFCSQLPCGDISNITNDAYDKLLKKSSDLSVEEDSNDLTHEVIKRRKLDDGIFINITGAKSLILKACDENDVGLGQPCTKPGRGSPTLSMSCSDKLAKWLHIGIQGSLLSMIIKNPICLHSITINSKCHFSKGSFYRALIDRSFRDKYDDQWEDLKDNNHTNLQIVPIIQQSQLEFDFDKSDETKPCPSSVVWSHVQNEPLQVAVNGKKLGATKKSLYSLSTSLMISKYNLFATFMSIRKHVSYLSDIPSDATYKSVKDMCKNYYNQWDQIKKDFFGVWTVKPDLLNFQVENIK